ncbi:MAG: molybdopterin-dependent oxidoreductase [Deltaproteobacteria bacterium]|nr:molybdopterin-dependent oxidoreductase [Deltaproteobacteria bacterium]
MGLGLLAAAAARRVDRPVKLALALEDGVRLHPKAPAMSLRVMLAGDAEGRLVGLKVRALVDLGGRPKDAEALVARIAEHMTGAYRVPHVEIEVQGVLTDNPSAGLVRGAGLTGGTFAVEGAIDQLAARLGVDPVTVRARSALRAGDAFGEGVLAEDPGVEDLLTALAPKVEAARAAGHKVGVALAVARQDGRAARVRLEPRDDGRVSLRVNVGEGGQGLHTALVAAVAAASNLSPDTFEVFADLGGPGAGDEVVLRAAAAAGALLKAKPHHAAEAEIGGDGAVRLNAVATLVTLDATGKVLAAESLGAAGPDAAPTLALGQLEGGLMWGLGAALVEELLCTDGLPDVRIRNMGTFRRARPPCRSAGPLGAKDGLALAPWERWRASPSPRPWPRPWPRSRAKPGRACPAGQRGRLGRRRQAPAAGKPPRPRAPDGPPSTAPSPSGASSAPAPLGRAQPGPAARRRASAGAPRAPRSDPASPASWTRTTRR